MDTRERTLAGRYRLEQIIGRGGMSTVYRARDEVLDRTVAVKVLLPALAEQDDTYAARFEREARAAAALDSSSVVTVYDTGVDDQGGRYIVMEYVSGRSLAEILAEGHPLELSESLRIAGRVADALRAAHRAGILHRDIKPANVMVANDGAVKVLDFGIARRLDGTTLTQAASIVGTAAYMAPERAVGQTGDARSDIYSLGCLLYAMLTGDSPFGGEVPAALLHQQVNADPPPPSKLRPGIPAALDALVLSMLAKPAAARPQTAEELGDRLLALTRSASRAGGVTAATAPLQIADRVGPRPRTGPTAPLLGARRMRAGVAAALADHRWRAVVMGLATALVALLAVALLSGGGSSATRAGDRTSARLVTHRATTTATHPAATVAPAHNAASNPQTTHAHGPAPGSPAPPGHGDHPPKGEKHGPGGGRDGGHGGGAGGHGGGNGGD